MALSSIRSGFLGMRRALHCVRYSTSTADKKLLAEYYRHHDDFLKEIYQRQLDVEEGKPVLVSIEEYFNLVNKLPKRDYGSFADFLTRMNIRVSTDHISGNLLKKPISRVVWRKPTERCPKLNTDASFILNEGQERKEGQVCGYGANVLRNEYGKVLKSKHFELKGLKNAFEAECEALKEGLILALKLGFKEIVIEGDNLVMIDIVNGRKHVPNRQQDRFSEIHKLLASFEDYEAYHIYREGNRLADCLASIKDSLLNGVTMTQVDERLNKIVEEDMNEVPNYRYRKE